MEQDGARLSSRRVGRLHAQMLEAAEEWPELRYVAVASAAPADANGKITADRLSSSDHRPPWQLTAEEALAATTEFPGQFAPDWGYWSPLYFRGRHWRGAFACPDGQTTADARVRFIDLANAARAEFPGAGSEEYGPDWDQGAARWIEEVLAIDTPAAEEIVPQPGVNLPEGMTVAGGPVLCTYLRYSVFLASARALERLTAVGDVKGDSGVSASSVMEHFAGAKTESALREWPDATHLPHVIDELERAVAEDSASKDGDPQPVQSDVSSRHLDELTDALLGEDGCHLREKIGKLREAKGKGKGADWKYQQFLKLDNGHVRLDSEDVAIMLGYKDGSTIRTTPTWRERQRKQKLDD